MCELYSDSDPKMLDAVPVGPVRVAVTEHDMSVGARYQSCGCPVAHAVARQFGLGRANVVVSTQTVTIRDNTGRVIRHFVMDETGKGFRVMWDCGARGQTPVTFQMTPAGTDWVQGPETLFMVPQVATVWGAA